MTRPRAWLGLASLGFAALVGCTTALPPSPRPSAELRSPSLPAVASPSTPVDPSPAPTIAPSPSAEPEATEFEPPAPACPAPPTAVAIPDVVASIADAPKVKATRGSSGFVTCSTSAVTDAVPDEPRVALVAHPDDVVTLAVPAGWTIVRWEGSDHPAVGDAANIWPPVDVPGGSRQIHVPVPNRTGDSIASYHLWVVSADARVVGSIDVEVRIRVGGS